VTNATAVGRAVADAPYYVPAGAEREAMRAACQG
jgi:hypothetical protein